MKAILLELPVQTHDYLYSRENVPLALGYLTACAGSAVPQVDVTIAPQGIMSYWGMPASSAGWKERPLISSVSIVDWVFAEDSFPGPGTLEDLAA